MRQRPSDVVASSDHALARRATLGDREAFAELFGRHSAATFRYALHMLDGDVHDAQDAAQDAWTKVWLRLPQFRGDSQLRTWLFQIVAREVFNLRRRKRPIPVDDTLLDARANSAAEPPHEIAQMELWEALSAALSELPWRQRASWLLREFEGLSYDDIAHVLETSPTVVRGQLHRARGALATRMEQWR